jgi:hypothetical protein
LNITDNDVLDERISSRLTNDDESDDAYLAAYHQLIQTHQQQQQIMSQQEQENMLSTIFEASCEDATPMTSLLDVHQQRIQVSSPLPPPIPIVEHKHVHDSEEEDEEDEQEEEEEEINRPIAPSFASLDDIPVSTIFSKNESKILKSYSLNFIVFYPRFKIQ